MRRILSFLLCFAVLYAGPVRAATNLVPFTVNLTENVIVNTAGGTPRIAIDVGGTTRYATYTSGSGSNALVFTYTVQVGDNDQNGVTLTSPIDLNGGTMKDAAGNNAVLSFTSPNTAGIIIGIVGPTPTGYAVFVRPQTVSNATKAAVQYFFTGLGGGETSNYTITSSGGGPVVTGSDNFPDGDELVTGIDVSGMNDGVLTFSTTITKAGATGAPVTGTMDKAILNGLVGHWTLDSSDSVAPFPIRDQSGSGAFGTAVGGITKVTGQVFGGLSFNGTTQYITLPNGTIKIPFPATIAAWINPNATTVANGAAIFANDTETAQHAGLRLQISAGGGISATMGDNVVCDPAGRVTKATGTGLISSGTWTHVAVTMADPTHFTIYINGVNAGGSYSGTSAAPQPVYSATNGGTIGGGVGCGGLTPLYGGIMDDVRLYNVALSAANITTLYNTH